MRFSTSTIAAYAALAGLAVSSPTGTPTTTSAATGASTTTTADTDLSRFHLPEWPLPQTEFVLEAHGNLPPALVGSDVKIYKDGIVYLAKATYPSKYTFSQGFLEVSSHFLTTRRFLYVESSETGPDVVKAAFGGNAPSEESQLSQWDTTDNRLTFNERGLIYCLVMIKEEPHYRLHVASNNGKQYEGCFPVEIVVERWCEREAEFYGTWISLGCIGGGPTPALKKGIFEIPLGESWLKSPTIRGGIVPLREYQPALLKLINSGRARPRLIVDRELRVNDAPEAYQEFSDHEFIKSVLRFGDTEDKHRSSSVEEEEGERPLRKKKGNGGCA